VPVAQARKVLEGQMRMPYSITGLDIWGEDVAGNPLVFQQGDVDGRCEPTGRGFLPVNWLGSPTALLPLWMLNEDGSPYLGDPRRALAAICERFRALGLTPVVATELEFYLVDTTGDVPTPPRSPVTNKFLDGDGALSIDDLDHFEAFFTDVYAACDAHGVPVDSAISENGGGQFEINLLHVPDPLAAADHALFFKRFVKGIARARIQSMRTAFVAGLKKAGAQQDFSFIEGQKGMFSFSGLTKDQVEALKRDHAIYIVGSGRINVAGMTESNMDALCKAIVSVL
jgi:glutamine synthetase